MSINCEDTQEAEDEMEELANYIGDRLVDGADMSRIMQAMVEALVELGEDDVSDTIH
tara:strand:+ start:466 stop:636 length:171 start_codon:yes stop_codon:yes gene_type:complete